MPHIHELIDFTASAYIVHEDRILLVHHKKLNAWMQIGGHIELNEVPDEALLREIEEECGLQVEVLAEKTPVTPSEHVEPLWRPHFINAHQFSPTHRHVDLGYVCRAITTEPRLEAEGAHAIGWFTREQFADLEMFDNVRELATLALDIAKQSS